jgi:adenosylcobinamide-GDP ribazoletransferase
MEFAQQDKSPMRSARTFFAGARAALAFLTRIPCGKQPVSEAALAWAPAWFPAVGCMLGLAGSLVLLGLARAGSMVASVAAVAFLALVTGAFHEDGLADSADALGGAFDRPKLFTILKDSRIGSFGAAALVLVLLLRITALAKLGPVAMVALVLSQTVSRTTPVWLMAVLPYVSPSETARSEKAVTRNAGQAVVATLFAAITTTGLALGQYLPLPGVLVAMAVAVGLVAVCGWRFHVRAGGITGDFLGATQQLTDAAILVTLAASG